MRITAERLVAGGDALARADDGRVVFVAGALPGEVVDVEVERTAKDFAKARLVEVIEASAARRTPPCVHRRDGCGGCDWMHLAPTAQLDAKADIVREALRRTARLDPAVVDALVVIGSSVDPIGYRTTIRPVGAGGGRVGFRERAGERVVPITHCQVAHPLLQPVLAALDVDDGVEVTLRVSAATGALSAAWDRKHRRGVRGLPEGVHVGERAWLIERVAGVDLRVSAGSFFQSGPQAAALLVDAVTSAAPELVGARHVVDAYGGVGLFAATAARDAERLTLIESSASACRDAAQNLTDREVVIVADEVGRWKGAAEGEPAVDVVIADPARPGLGKPGVGALAAAGAPVLVVVSCDPVSLARDVTLLDAAGYVPERCEVLDLFPETHHVEVVTRFTRR